MTNPNPKIIGFCGKTTSPTAVFLSGMYIFIVLAVLLPTTKKWLKCRDYYPIKERSPLLSLLLGWVLLFFTCLYPWQIIYSYVSGNSRADAYRIGYYTFKYSAYFIYMVRSFRICYAYRVFNRDTWVFRNIFAKEWVLVLVTISMLYLKSIPVTYFETTVLDQSIYITPIDTFECENLDDQQIANIYLIKRLLQDWIWTIILVTCLWIERHIEKELGVFVQICWVLAADIILHLFQAVLTLQRLIISKDTICLLSQWVCIDESISIFIINITIQTIIMFIVTIILPLTKIRLQHTMLPIEPNYVPDNHFKIFLMNPTCYVRFRNFLHYYDSQITERGSETKVYSRILDCWTCIVSMKFSNVDQREFTRFLNNLDAAIIDRHILNNLKQSIQALNSISVQSDSESLKKDINTDIDIVETNLLEKLWHIYGTKFVKTKCYYYLEKIREDNNRVNTNMTELNMMLITTK